MMTDEQTCLACGRRSSGRFCAHCGAALEATNRDNSGADEPETWISEDRQPWAPLPPLPPAGSPEQRYPSPSFDDDPSSKKGRSKAPAVAAGVAALLVIGGGAWWATRSNDTSAQSVSSAQTQSPSQPVTVTVQPTPTAPSTTAPSAQPTAPPTVSTQTVTRTMTVSPTVPSVPTDTPARPDEGGSANAAQQLEQLHSADASRFIHDPHVFVQLAGKKPGARIGGKTWTSAEILAQHQELRNRFANVVLLKGADLGSQTGAAEWLTIYDPRNLSSKKDADAWCRRNVGGTRNNCYGAEIKP